MESFISPGTRIQEFMVPVSGDVHLRVVNFRPAFESPYPPVVFIPGLASVMENFREVVFELTKEFTIYYLETREKKTSTAGGKDSFSMQDLSSDLSMVLDALKLDDGHYILCGYSLGATAIMDGYEKIRNKPAMIVLAEPNGSFPFPGWLIFLARFAVPLYPLIKPLLKWYIRTFRVNMKTDPELYQINCRIFDSADPRKLAAIVKGIRGYSVWDKLQKIHSPVLLLAASQDRFHNHSEAMAIAARIEGAHYIDLVNNKRSHSAEVVMEIAGFWEQLQTSETSTELCK